MSYPTASFTVELVAYLVVSQHCQDTTARTSTPYTALPGSLSTPHAPSHWSALKWSSGAGGRDTFHQGSTVTMMMSSQEPSPKGGCTTLLPPKTDSAAYHLRCASAEPSSISFWMQASNHIALYSNF